MRLTLLSTVAAASVGFAATALAQSAAVQSPSGQSPAVQSAVSPDGAKFLAAQMPGEIRASNLAGVVVKNKVGDVVGDISDVVFGATGQVSVYIIGVGGVLGIGEKNVAVPFSSVMLATDKDNKRTATLDVTKAALEAAPTFAGERTTFEKVEDGAAGLAAAASQKAKELKDKMTAPTPANAPK